MLGERPRLWQPLPAGCLAQDLSLERVRALVLLTWGREFNSRWGLVFWSEQWFRPKATGMEEMN